MFVHFPLNHGAANGALSKITGRKIGVRARRRRGSTPRANGGIDLVHVINMPKDHSLAFCKSCRRTTKAY